MKADPFHAPNSANAREIVAAALFFLLYFVAYFSPILFGNRLLAIGDAVAQYLPALLAKHSLWIHNLYAGHPAFADPQYLTFSPLRVARGNYNAAVIGVYVLAGTGTYCLVRHLTGLRMAGIIAGIIYSSCGAMMAHLPHLTIIYSAAFTPLIVWSVAASRTSPSAIAMSVGAAAIALSLLGGHPQVFVYSLALAGAYALYIIAASPGNRMQLLGRYAVLFGAGLAFACIQLIPLAEIGARSIRQEFDFAQFTSYSLSPRDLLLLIFPWIMGGHGVNYFGSGNLAELTPFCGVATIMLAIAAVSARERQRQTGFWVAAAVVAIAYALGDSTPLASIAFHVPGWNQFRAPARSAFVTALAFAILAGFGYRALVEGRLRGVHGARMWFAILALAGVAILLLYMLYPSLDRLAAGHGARLPAIIDNRAVYVPLLMIALSAICIAAMLRKPAIAVQFALMIIVVIDLASFGWHTQWQHGAWKSMLKLDTQWLQFARDVDASNERVLFLDGVMASGVPAAPNQSLLYGLPSASAYGPLILKNYADATGLGVTGASGSLLLLKERLQLLGAAWLVGGGNDDRPISFGGTCTPARGRSFSAIRLPRTFKATRLEIVSHLGCSTALEQGTQVVRINTRNTAGKNAEYFLRAGIDTAEWAIDRADVAAAVRHQRPPRFTTYSAGSYDGHWYSTTVDLASDGQPTEVGELDLQWLLPPGPGIAFKSIVLVDTATGARHSVSAQDFIWSEIGLAEERSLPGDSWVRRVKGVGSIAWIVGETIRATPKQALDVIRSGRLPDGREYDPYLVALVDGTGQSALPVVGAPKSQVRIVERDNGMLKMNVESSRDAFLVVAESFYPGWTATIDGVATPIVQTNLAFQGLHIPAGKHNVVMSFMPMSLVLGIAVAIIGLVILIAYLFIARRRSPTHRSHPFVQPLPSRW